MQKHTTSRRGREEEEAEREKKEGKLRLARGATMIRVVWRGGGRNVQLMRAGDNNWKGRRLMDYEYVYF